MKKSFQIISVVGCVLISCLITKGATLVDDFNSGISPARWEILQEDAAGAPWTVQAPDSEGRLQISKLADPGSTKIGARIRSRFTLNGDFSAFVDFNLVVFPLSIGGLNEAVLTAWTTNINYHMSSLRLTDINSQMVEAFSPVPPPGQQQLG
ncbi:MAG: hypothetical protein WC975_03190 [Phycisphaerae bacterium]